MDFNNTKAYAFESWLMPACGKQRDLVVVGSEKTAKIDYPKPQELQIFDIRIAEQDYDGNTAFNVENEGSYTIPIPFGCNLIIHAKPFLAIRCNIISVCRFM